MLDFNLNTLGHIRVGSLVIPKILAMMAPGLAVVLTSSPAGPLLNTTPWVVSTCPWVRVASLTTIAVLNEIVEIVKGTLAMVVVIWPTDAAGSGSAACVLVVVTCTTGTTTCATELVVVICWTG